MVLRRSQRRALSMLSECVLDLSEFVDHIGTLTRPPPSSVSSECRFAKPTFHALFVDAAGTLLSPAVRLSSPGTIQL